MTIAKLLVKASARNQRCLERIYINWNPYSTFLLSMNGMRWSVSRSSGQCFCTEPMLLETHAIWSFQKQFLILGIPDTLKCNRKALALKPKHSQRAPFLEGLDIGFNANVKSFKVRMCIIRDNWFLLHSIINPTRFHHLHTSTHYFCITSHHHNKLQQTALPVCILHYLPCHGREGPTQSPQYHHPYPICRPQRQTPLKYSGCYTTNQTRSKVIKVAIHSQNDVHSHIKPLTPPSITTFVFKMLNVFLEPKDAKPLCFLCCMHQQWFCVRACLDCVLAHTCVCAYM